MGSMSRISARIAAISESATLAVDAKPKALKAARRPVIVFGAGEPDLPPPDYIVAAAGEACRTARRKVLLICSTSNATGGFFCRGQVEAIGRWALEQDLWVLTDEIYEHLVYGDAEFHSLPVVVPELADRVVVVNGVAKTYAMTGWRVGWLVGPAHVVKTATNPRSHATPHVSNVPPAAAPDGV